MTDRREFFARTIEEAVAKASEALSVPRDQLGFEVLDQGSAGFLGLGARDARIMVSDPASSATGPPMVQDELSSRSLDRGESLPSEDSVDLGEFTVIEELEKSAQDSSEPISPSAEAPYELIVAVDEFMTLLMDAMGFDATVDAYDAGDAIVIDVGVKETGLFIGQKGETIDAIQYLANVAIYRSRPFFKRLVVDSEGYRQRRIEAIQGMAHRTARKALREKRPIGLPPMSPAERRVVHLFLQDNPKVTTSSDGEEEDRRVIVNPA